MTDWMSSTDWMSWEAFQQMDSMPLCIYGGLVGPRGIYIGHGGYSQRQNRHLGQLRASKAINALFQDAVDRYGLETVRFKLLQLVPNGISKSAIEQREYLLMDVFEAEGWTILNVLRSPDKPGRRFRIGPGGRWPRATKRKAP